MDHSVSYAFDGFIETFDNYVMILTRIQLLRSILGCFPFKNLWCFQSTHLRYSEVFSSGRRNPHPKWSGSQLANGTSTVKMDNRLISGCSVVKLFQKLGIKKTFKVWNGRKFFKIFVHKRFLAHFKRTLPGAHRNKAQKPGWEFSRPPNDTWPPVQGGVAASVVLVGRTPVASPRHSWRWKDQTLLRFSDFVAKKKHVLEK